MEIHPIANEFIDTAFRVFDNGDATKKVALQLSGVTTGNTRTLTVPDVDTKMWADNGSVPLTANWDVGSFNIRALSGTFDSLTSGRVPFASTNGLLVDDSDMTFAGDTLTVTTLDVGGVATVLSLVTDAGTENVIIGLNAGDNDFGVRNIFVGELAGFNNDTTGAGSEGDKNVYIGYRSGYGFTAATDNTGYENVAIGEDTLMYNTTGYRNFALGRGAMRRNSTGYANVAIGVRALGRDTATAITGYYNVGVGYEALREVTSARHCIGIGQGAVRSIQSGQRNIGIGYEALLDVTTTNSNIAIGSQSGLNITGYENVIIGTFSTQTAAYSSRNVCIGHDSARNGALGSNNVIIGHDCGKTNAAGSDELWIDGDDIATPLIFGYFNAHASGPALTINGSLTVSGATGDLMFDTSVDSSSVANEVSLGGYEIGAGQRALAISQEYGEIVEVDETKFSHKLPVRINGSTYYIMLTAT